MIVVRYAMGWEPEPLDTLGLKREHAVICPGCNAAHSKFWCVEVDFETTSRLVTTFGRYPHFALLPLRWYTGQEVDTVEVRLEVTMKRSFWDMHMQFFYVYVLGTLWELGEVFTSGSLHIMHSKHIRVGLKKYCLSFVEKNMEHWLVTMGLEIRDE